MTSSSHGTWKVLESSFDTALERLPQALSAEGFGVITQIDMQQTMKAKLGVDFRRYRILGACNPKLAHQALTQDPDVGVLLPCNVVLYERDDGKAVLGAIDPMQTLGDGAGPLTEVAKGVADKLSRVLDAVK